MIHTTVSEGDAGIRLDRWFKRHYPGASHSMVEKWLRKGLIRVDGKKAESATRIETGQELRFPEEVAEMKTSQKVLAKIEMTDRQAKDLQKLVIFKNQHVLVLNKPAGLAVQGGSGQTKHLDGMLDALKFDAPERPKLVHRLDKDTSGVLVLARTAKAAAELGHRFQGKDIEKIYIALVKGVPKPREGVIDRPLSKSSQGKFGREQMGVDEEEGVRAVTEYRVTGTLGKQLAWVELSPITGRTHQLRVHMAAIGHVIVGDGKYGGRSAFIEGLEVSEKLHLHAHSIMIPNLFGKDVYVTAPLPPHMKESLESLGGEG